MAVTQRRLDGLVAQRTTELRRLAARVVGDQMAAEDIVQETFVRLTSSEVDAEDESALAAWLRRVTLNLAFNWRRDRGRAALRDDRYADRDRRFADDPAETALREDERRRVRAILATLPDRQRACLLLRHSGCSYAEIAATLEIAIGSVGVLLMRGERSFKERYREDDVS